MTYCSTTGLTSGTFDELAVVGGGTGKVLTSDEDGNATWQDPPSTSAADILAAVSDLASTTSATFTLNKGGSTAINRTLYFQDGATPGSMTLQSTGNAWAFATPTTGSNGTQYFNLSPDGILSVGNYYSIEVFPSTGKSLTFMLQNSVASNLVGARVYAADEEYSEIELYRAKSGVVRKGKVRMESRGTGGHMFSTSNTNGEIHLLDNADNKMARFGASSSSINTDTMNITAPITNITSSSYINLASPTLYINGSNMSVSTSSVNGNWTGAGLNVNQTIYFTRMGSIVFVNLPACMTSSFTATYSDTYLVFSGLAPVSMRPSYTGTPNYGVVFPISLMNSNAIGNVTCNLNITTTGSIYMGRWDMSAFPSGTRIQFESQTGGMYFV